MIIHQHWTPDKKVMAFAVSVNTAGMTGWQLHSTTYDPATGETSASNPWVLVGAAHDMASLVRYQLLSEMAKSVDNPAEVITIATLFDRLMTMVDALGKQLKEHVH